MAILPKGWLLLLAAPARGPERVLLPDPDAGVLSLAERKKAQLAAVDQRVRDSGRHSENATQSHEGASSVPPG